jgi:two-component system, OmpR family, response regulator
VEPIRTPTRRLNVLVVDDNRDAADSTATLVELWGHTARTAYDGTDGWRMVQEWHPDFLILDINMPGLDGYALAERVKQTPGLEGTRMVAVSAYSDAQHLRRVMEAGFDFRLTKPADPRELEEILNMMERIKSLAEQTGELSQQNVKLAAQTKELLEEVKEDIKEVKEDIKELKEEVRDLKDKSGE